MKNCCITIMALLCGACMAGDVVLGPLAPITWANAGGNNKVATWPAGGSSGIPGYTLMTWQGSGITNTFGDQSYLPNQLTTNLILWVPCWGTNAVDLSTNQVQATFSATPPTWVTNGGGSFQFAPNANWILCGTGTYMIANTMSWAWWGRLTNGSTYYTGIGKEGASGGKSWRVWLLAGVNQFRLHINNSATLNANWTPQLNAWHHFGIVYNGPATNVAYYVDGIVVASGGAGVTSIPTSTNAVTIGVSMDSGNPYAWAGQISDVMIWNAPKTSNDILKAYSIGSTNVTDAALGHAGRH